MQEKESGALEPSLGSSTLSNLRSWALPCIACFAKNNAVHLTSLNGALN